MSYDSPRPDAVAHNLILPAAEMGLLYRPIHLLVGHLPWSECLSPYTRDLTITLDQFAEREIVSGNPLPLKPADPMRLEEWRYEIAEHFLARDENRATEKKQVEAKLGIMRLCAGYPHSVWIDSKRLDWDAVDSRLVSLSQELIRPEPVWLILAPQDFHEFAEVLQEVIKKLRTQLRSFTSAPEYQEATFQEQAPATQFFVLPRSEASPSLYHQAVQTVQEIEGQKFIETQLSYQ